MILVCARCYNEEKNIPRFLKCYGWADKILISDGGSTDKSLELLEGKCDLIHFGKLETVKGETWNPDNPHIQFLFNAAREYKPDWIIFDDMDDVPNYILQEQARSIFEKADRPQINAFRLYLWGENKYFPFMNRNFDPNYRSLWAWKPSEVNIHASIGERHGTILGTLPDPYPVEIPACLLHYTYDPATIDKKVARYNALGLPMIHPLQTIGALADLPEWAHI